ncbi:MAG: hypothetical protein PVH54_08260, partial [Gammaproteobacteria bacterium]
MKIRQRGVPLRDIVVINESLATESTDIISKYSVFFRVFPCSSVAISQGQDSNLLKEPLTWTPPVCQVSIGEEDRLQSYIRPVDG